MVNDNAKLRVANDIAQSLIDKGVITETTEATIEVEKDNYTRRVSISLDKYEEPEVDNND